MKDPLNFDMWMLYGLSRGWISAPYCEQHDVSPVSPIEEKQIEEEDDPDAVCRFATRLWGAS